jgi:hypothetical protein
VTGCAVQGPVQFTAQLDNNKTIGIVRTDARVAETQYTGQIGLLDYAVISAVNSSVDKHLKTLDFFDYRQVSQEIDAVLKGRGFKTLIIDEVIDLKTADKFKDPKDGKNKNDFSRFQKDYGVDYLLLVKMGAIGTTRSYYGPVPLTEPMSQAILVGQMIDLHTNELVWYRVATAQTMIQTPWDEADSQYPNLTNAVYSSLNDAMRMLEQDLKMPATTNASAIGATSSVN